MTTERIGYDYPSDEQFSILNEMAKGVADHLSLVMSDPDYPNADEDIAISILQEVGQLVWGEGLPDSPMPPIAKAVETGFTNREACAAFAGMMCMWHHLHPPRSTD